MNNKTGKVIEKILFGLAIGSFVVAFIEGLFYYTPEKYSNEMIRYMLIVQNTIRAFVFKSDIKIDDVAKVIQISTSFWEIAVGYIYLVTIFIAPYCTLSFSYKFLKKVFCLRKRHYFRKYESIIIFGYNNEIKSLLKDYHKNYKELKKYKIHVVDENISNDDEIQLLMDGVVLHQTDCLKLSGKQLKAFFTQIKLNSAKYIILFDESAVRNFSLYKMFHDEKDKADIDKDVKFLCRCENSEIMPLIEEFHDNESEFDMETVSMPELRIRHTLKNTPLHKYYLNKPDVPVGEWNLHLLIVGFGKMGQQVLLQAMNQGVVSSTNKILVDVVDYNIENKSSIFANNFNEDYVKIDKDRMVISSDKADGELLIRFHKMDVRYKQFFSLLKEYGNREKDGIYTYVAICVEDEEAGIHCLSEVQRYMKKYAAPQDYENIGIVIRMEMNKYVKEYLNRNDKTFKNVVAMEDNSDVITINKLIRDELDENAREFNRIYNRIQIVNAKDANSIEEEKISEDEATVRKELWRELKLFRRESNRALAEHTAIKEVVWNNLMKGKDQKQQLKYLFGQDGVILKENKGKWTYDNEDEFVKKQSNQELYPYVSEMSRMEHRRWCYFMASRGFSSAQAGDDKLDKATLDMERRSICLVNWDDLVKVKKENCKYDLVWLLRKYRETL